MLLEMGKIRVIGTKRRLEEAVRLLHQAGVLQIERLGEGTPLPAIAVEGQRQEERRELSFLNARLEGIVSLFPRPKALGGLPGAEYEGLQELPTGELLREVRQGLEEIGPEVQALAERKDALEDELVALPNYEDTVRRLIPLATGMVTLSGFGTVAVMIERRYAFVVDLIREELEGLTGGQFELVSGDVDERTVAALVVFPRRFGAGVESLLAREHITRLRLPEELSDMPFTEALSRIEERQKSIPRELEGIGKKLEELAAGWYGKLLAWRGASADRIEEVDVLSHFGETRRAFVVEGWLPKRDIPRLERLLEEGLKGEASVMKVEVSHHELGHAPVAFHNPRIVQPFETFIRLLALPRYGTLDPTPLMAIFLPLFFGLILGDVFYGLVVAAGALYLVRKSRPASTMSNLGKIILMGALWAIVWGVVFGEFLGDLGEHFGMPRLWINRKEAMIPLIVFSISIGVAHVFLGLVLGLWNALREKSRRELMERAGMLISLVALFLVVAAATNRLPSVLKTPSAALLIIGLVLLVASLSLGLATKIALGWLLGGIEVLGAFGNILSYIRLAAIGVSSVYLAEVANKMAGAVGNIALGAIIAAFLHILNIALGVLSPTIQSLRLHYVEFFGKFYASGGQEYAPFRREEIE